MNSLAKLCAILGLLIVGVVADVSHLGICIESRRVKAWFLTFRGSDENAIDLQVCRMISVRENKKFPEPVLLPMSWPHQSRSIGWKDACVTMWTDMNQNYKSNNDKRNRTRREKTTETRWWLSWGLRQNRYHAFSLPSQSLELDMLKNFFASILEWVY